MQHSFRMEDGVVHVYAKGNGKHLKVAGFLVKAYFSISFSFCSLFSVN